jgi:hypothetical protein
MTARRNRYARIATRNPFDRRLTQVFLRGLTAVGAPRVCLNEPPVSDHYGLEVTLGIGA